MIFDNINLKLTKYFTAEEGALSKTDVQLFDYYNKCMRIITKQADTPFSDIAVPLFTGFDARLMPPNTALILKYFWKLNIVTENESRIYHAA